MRSLIADDDDILEESVFRYNLSLWILPKKPDSKDNKRWRPGIDFRALNEKTIASAYLLPNITGILDQLGRSQYFSTLDLASGLHQVPIDPAGAHKTAFSPPFIYLQYKQKPMGLKGSPVTFQNLMDRVLTSLQGIEMFVYMDDIVVYALSLTEHKNKMMKLFGRPAVSKFSRPQTAKNIKHILGVVGHY